MYSKSEDVFLIFSVAEKEKLVVNGTYIISSGLFIDIYIPLKSKIFTVYFANMKFYIDIDLQLGLPCVLIIISDLLSWIFF